jgi:hypothetical protein
MVPYCEQEWRDAQSSARARQEKHGVLAAAGVSGGASERRRGSRLGFDVTGVPKRRAGRREEIETAAATDE